MANDRTVTLTGLGGITHFSGGSVPMVALPYGDYLDPRARQTSFDALTGWAFHRQSFANRRQERQWHRRDRQRRLFPGARRRRRWLP
jgi:hypothetical protein